MALSRGQPRAWLRVQPYFLQPAEKWAPSPVTDVEFFDFVHEIEDRVVAEMQLVVAKIDEDGKVIDCIARAEDFPPSPPQSVRDVQVPHRVPRRENDNRWCLRMLR